MKKILYIFLLIGLTFGLFACETAKTKSDYDLYKEIYSKNDTYYQIFIRSFADSDNDGIGDFNGITQNLDYLSELGVTALWMLPFTNTENDWLSYHGYRVTDYYSVNPEYGTLDDLTNLINTASDKGIKIVMDLVINHTSDTHPWYLDAKTGVSAEYRDYYVWQNENNAFESFPGGMKDLNLNNPKVVSELKSIMDFWMSKGIKGFRFDAAKHFFVGDPGTTPAVELTKTYQFLRDLQLHARTFDEEVFFLGEVFEYDYNAYKNYYIGLDSLFDFNVASTIWQKIGNRTSTYNFSTLIKRAYDSYYPYNKAYIPSNFISNHDIDRIASKGEFSGANSLEKLKQAASVLLTLPGNAHIYYGEELGMKGTNFESTGENGKDLTGQGVIYDQYRRAPLDWGTTDYKTTSWLKPYKDSNANPSIKDALVDDSSLLNHYKKLANIRKNNPALMFGNQMEVWKGSSGQIQGYLRFIESDNHKQALLVLHNMTQLNQTADVDYESFILGDSLVLKPYETIILALDFDQLSNYF